MGRKSLKGISNGKDAYYESVDREQMFQRRSLKELDPAEVEKIAEKCSKIVREMSISKGSGIDDALIIKGTVDIVKRDIDEIK